MDRVLLVDDSLDCQLLVGRALQGSVSLDIAGDLSKAKERLASTPYDLLLLDVGLPDGNGFGFCSRFLAETGAARPRVIFLTGSQTVDEKLVGFSVGADDYITKPFNPLELKARVLAHLRARTERTQAAQLHRTGNLTLNLSSHWAEVHPDGAALPVRLDLTPTEFRLLHVLVRNEGRILSREQLLEVMSGHGEELSDRTVDAHLSKLRKKLVASTHGIEAVYGIGYRWTRTEPN